MACDDLCCPPHNFDAIEDPTVNDCNNSTVPSYAGGYCPGSYWYNNTTGILWIGANDMACGSALWINLNPSTMYHLDMGINSTQQFDSIIVPGHGWTVAGNKIQYNVINNEQPSTAWAAGSFQCVIPDDGIYQISAGLVLESARLTSPVQGTQGSTDFVNTEFDLDLVVNGTRTKRIAHYVTEQMIAAQVVTLAGSSSQPLSAGDIVYITMTHTMDDYIDTNSTLTEWARGYLAIDQMV